MHSNEIFNLVFVSIFYSLFPQFMNLDLFQVKGGREGRPLGAFELAQAVEDLGAGEILLNCIDRDGTDFQILAQIPLFYPFLAKAGDNLFFLVICCFSFGPFPIFNFWSISSSTPIYSSFFPLFLTVLPHFPPLYNSIYSPFFTCFPSFLF